MFLVMSLAHVMLLNGSRLTGLNLRQSAWFLDGGTSTCLFWFCFLCV